MTSVEIEYCVPCGSFNPVAETQTRLLDAFGQELDGVTLSPGHGGVFEVKLMARRSGTKTSTALTSTSN